MDFKLKTSETGFTLLELLIALALASLILVGVYQVVDGAVAQRRVLEEHREALQLWLHLRRLLRRDWEMRVVDKDALLVFKAGELAFPALGSVVGGRLGPRVFVRYLWKPASQGEGVMWQRRVVPLNGREGERGVLTLGITENLRTMQVTLLDQEGWKRPDEERVVPLRAVQWRFAWNNFGEWRMIKGGGP